MRTVSKRIGHMHLPTLPTLPTACAYSTALSHGGKTHVELKVERGTVISGSLLKSSQLRPETQPTML